MRLYLSSYRLGNHPEELVALLPNGKSTAVIANAGDHWPASEERTAKHKEVMDELVALGLEPVDLDLRDYFGKKEELKKELSGFDLVWVKGGNAFILRRAFKYSGADEVIKELLATDSIVYGGYSAGPDMLVPSLRGTELVDDPNVVPEGYDPEIVWDGMGVVPYAFAPHYKSNHPESVDVSKAVEYLIDNHMPFIALRDGEVIVINGEKITVIK